MYSKQWTRIILITSPFAIALSLLLSILYGAKHLSTDIVFTSLIHFDPGNTDHQIIWHSRIPRAAGALLIGAALAVSGALMQGITRNYLASPSIMGVSDGSAFIITLCMVLLPQSSSIEMIIYSFIGSALGAVLVFGLAAMMPNGFTPCSSPSSAQSQACCSAVYQRPCRFIFKFLRISVSGTVPDFIK